MVLRRVLWLVMVTAVTGGCGVVAETSKNGRSEPTFASEIAGWVSHGDPEVYDTETIYAYIDGHAEVYMAYGFRRCISQRYSGPDGDAEIVVDLFEMASPDDAYGVFSHDQAGEVVALGQGGVYRLGWLSFWSGAWVGSVYASGIEGDAREDVLALARSAAASLPVEGEVPDLVSALPPEGLDPTSVCFLRSPQILNAHIYVGADDPFSLGPETEAVVGRYQRDGSPVHVIIVNYPTEAAAEAVEERARGRSESDGPEMLMGRDGITVAAVVGTETGDRAEALLAEVLGGDE